jgi:hypothetical protein
MGARETKRRSFAEVPLMKRCPKGIMGTEARQPPRGRSFQKQQWLGANEDTSTPSRQARVAQDDHADGRVN